MNPFEYDFGYSWQYSYVHLIPLAVGLIALLLSIRFKRSRWLVGMSALVATWGLAGLLIVQFALRANLPLALPTQAFLKSGEGRVLDVGAGSGRAALMVLLARPKTSVVALDWFKMGYGIDENTPARLLKNASIAGASDRVEVQSADMREMPLAAESFDAVVSAYAIDHMRRDDSLRALREVNRVLRPGGEFLLEVLEADAYVHTAFPIIGAHGYFGPNNAVARWRDLLQQAQFEIIESGHVPGTLYILARKALEPSNVISLRSDSNDESHGTSAAVE
jgi:SAM-dependent methyltransferase